MTELESKDRDLSAPDPARVLAYSHEQPRRKPVLGFLLGLLISPVMAFAAFFGIDIMADKLDFRFGSECALWALFIGTILAVLAHVARDSSRRGFALGAMSGVILATLFLLLNELDVIRFTLP